MSRIKIQDIIFFLLLAAVVALAIWKLIDSPTDTATLISIALFIVGSELLLWKYYFNIDKNTSIGFMKVKHDMQILRKEMNRRFDNIENLIKKKKWQT